MSVITIEINNSYSQIKGLNTEQYKELRELLSYESDPSTKYFSGGYSHKKYLIDAKGFFPTGLLYKIKAFVPTATYLDLRIKPKRKEGAISPVKGITPYSEQNRAVSEAYSKGVGGIIMPTGTGKSITMALLVNAFRLKTLVVVPNLELKTQLADTFSSLIPKAKVTVLNIDSNELETATGYDLLILDECHGSASKTYQRLNKKQWSGIYHRFFFTATFFRNQDNEQLLFESICGRPIYELTYKNAVKNGLIVPVEAYYLEVPKQANDCYTYQQFYKELVVNNQIRNKLLADTMVSLDQGNVYTLTLVKEVAHGEILSEMTGIPFANGADDSSRQYLQDFKDGKITSVIATEGIAGTGCDTKPCEYVIFAGLGKAKSAILQKCGRGTRRYKDKESCKVILVRDSSHKYSLSHFREQCKVLKDYYGIVPTKL